jgi:hypothetical protein
MKKYSCNNLKAIYKKTLKINYVDFYVFYTIKLNNLLNMVWTNEFFSIEDWIHQESN